MRSITFMILVVFSFSSLWATYTVTVEADGLNGTVSPVTLQTIEVQVPALKLNIYAYPNDGYKLTTWAVTGGADLTVDQLAEVETFVSGGVEDGAYTVTATFEWEGYSLTIADPTGGSVNKDPDKPLYLQDEVVELTAVPDPGYYFTVWSDDLSGSNPMESITMNGDKTVTASFSNTYTLTYTTDGNGTISGTATQYVLYEGDGEEVEAVPDENYYHFVDWSDLSTVNPRTDENVTADITVTANFAIDQYNVNVLSDGNGTVDPDGIEKVDHGGELDISATHATDYRFVNWTVTGGLNVDVNAASTTITGVEGAGSVTANFKANPVVSNIQDQTVYDPAKFATIDLDSNVSDDDTQDDQITWTAKGPSNPKLTIGISDRIATIEFTSPPTSIIDETWTFTAKDDSDNPVDYGFDNARFRVYPTLVVTIDDPITVEAYTGWNTSFTVNPTGGGGVDSYSYRWLLGDDPISNGNGGNLVTLPLNNLQSGDDGEYTCVVTTNGDHSVTSSDTAELTVRQTAWIRYHPSSVTAWPGDEVSFEITARGYGDIEYEWKRDNDILPGQITNKLTIASVTSADKGVYRCIATNLGGSATSNPASLTVNGPAEITDDPVDTTVYTGGRIRLNVEAIGTLPMTYQWQKNDANLTNTSATTDQYNKNNVVLDDAGIYKCIVSNNDGANIDVSEPATVTVLVTAHVTAHPSPLTKDPGESATFSVTAAGEPTIIYQWYRANNSIPNATEATYTIPSVAATHAGYYRCRVRNDGGYDNSNWAQLNVNGPAVIIDDPKDTVGWTGGEVAFGVVASGTAPLAYQWQKNNVDIPSATNELLSLSSLTLSDSGYYRVIVSNTLNIDTSSNAHLQIKITVSITEQPESQTVYEGDSVSFSVAAAGSETITYLWYKNGFPVSGATNDTFAIAKVTAADAGNYTCVARNGGGRDTSTSATLEVLGGAFTLTAPNGGETWDIETTQDITWTTTGNIDNVKLEFSSTGGSSWQLITPSTPNTGTYTWQIPIVITEFCKVRISDAEDDFPADESDSLFALNKITAIQDQDKNPESLCSRFLIAPNPVNLNEANAVQLLVTPGSRMVNAEVKIYDAVGNLIYAFENDRIEEYPVGSCMTLGSWNLTNTHQRIVAGGAYLVVVLFTSPEGEKEIVKQVIGIKTKQ